MSHLCYLLWSSQRTSRQRPELHVPIVAWRTIQWLWLTNPCGALTAQAWSHTRPHLHSEQCLWTTAMGTGSIYSSQNLAKRREPKAIVGEKILSPLSNRGRHYSITWWMRKYVSGGEMAHCMKAFQEMFVMKLAHKEEKELQFVFHKAGVSQIWLTSLILDVLYLCPINDYKNILVPGLSDCSRVTIGIWIGWPKHTGSKTVIWFRIKGSGILQFRVLQQVCILGNEVFVHLGS